MDPALPQLYRAYIACLNQQDWPRLPQFVHPNVFYNAQPMGLEKYRELLQRNFAEVPDLHFNVQLLVSQPPHLASRLFFDCAPAADFLGLPINGKRIAFTENVFSEFQGDKIYQVWSVIDKAAIEAQL